ncbi:MAG: hypothetical protein WDN08_19295 [Rhizomicrobium sp.]
MKPQAGQPQIVKAHRMVQSIEDLDTTLDQILPDAAAPPGFEQLPKALIQKMPDHPSNLLTTRHTLNRI